MAEDAKDVRLNTTVQLGDMKLVTEDGTVPFTRDALVKAISHNFYRALFGEEKYLERVGRKPKE